MINTNFMDVPGCPIDISVADWTDYRRDYHLLQAQVSNWNCSIADPKT